MITLSSIGDWSATTKWLKKLSDLDLISILDNYGRLGVEALAAATPVDTGKTASSWEYAIKKTKDRYDISWSNTNVNNGVPIAMVIQYGHVTKNGFYVPGLDYINPALQPIYNDLIRVITEEVRR